MRSLRTWIKTLRAIAFIYGGLTNFTQEQHHHSLAHIISSETMAKTNDNDKERRGEGDEEGKQHMVFDLFHDVKRGWDTHYGTIIVQEAPCQVYKIPSLNNTLHYAIRGKANMDRRIKDLVDDGFELLTEQCLRSGDRPRRFLIIVPPGMNITGVKEIEVINDFRALGKEEATGKEAEALFEKIPFAKLTNYLVKKQDVLRSKKDNRNSRNLSAGYSQQRQTNSTMCPGLNTPEFTNSTDKLPQIDEESGQTVTQSMLKYGCSLMELSDLISRETGSQRAFTDRGRVTMFMNPVAHIQKIPPNYLRFEGVTVGNTGPNMLMCEEYLGAHFDIGNDPRSKHGQNLVLCANKIVEVEYKKGKTIKTRTAVIIYSKKCVGDSYERYSLYQPIALKYERWIEDCHPLLHVNPETIQSLGLSDRPSQLHMIRPQWTKRFYYSPYINEILKVGKENNWNGALMLEVAYAIVFTPNAKTFCHGVGLALKCTRNENFIFRYIDSLVGVYGSVSGGKGRRRMCSHQRKVSRYRIMKSLSNLPRLLEIANKPGTKTTDVIKQFVKSPEKGGMFLMGQLSCQEFLHILTMVSKVIYRKKFICNQCHKRNVAISTSTKTSKRLVSHHISSDTERKKLMQFLQVRLSKSHSTQGTIDNEAIENGLCESLRYNAGIRVHEYIGDTIYTETENNGMLVAYNLRGEEVDLKERFGKPIPSLPNDNECKGVMWWVTGQLRKHQKLCLAGDILLTTKT